MRLLILAATSARNPRPCLENGPFFRVDRNRPDLAGCVTPTAGSAVLPEIGCHQLPDFFVDQRPKGVAAQAGEGAEGDGHGAVFAAQ